MFAILKFEFVVMTYQLDISRGEHTAILVPQYRYQHLVAQLHLRRLPVDIEVGRIAAGCAILQYVPPILVVADQ